MADLIKGKTADGQYKTIRCTTAGVLLTTESTGDADLDPSTVAFTVIAATTVSGEILAANSDRHWAMVENFTASRMYVRLGAGTAGVAMRSLSLGQNESASINNFTGALQAAWSAGATFGCGVTEIT